MNDATLLLKALHFAADKVTLNVYFHATPTGIAEARLDPNEVAEIGWFPSGELPSTLAFPGHIPKVLSAWRLAAEEPSATAKAPERPSSIAAPGN